MWRRFIEFIRRLFSNEKRLVNLLTDEEIEREVKKKEENLRLLHEIVGESPLDQIDWIIENGYDKYHEKYKSYEDGSIETNNPDFNDSYNVKYVQQTTNENRMKMTSTSINSSLVFKSKTGERYFWETCGSFQLVKPEDVPYLFLNEQFMLEGTNDGFTIDLKTAAEFHNLSVGYTKGTKEEKEIDYQLKQTLNNKDYRLYSPANEMKVELRGGIGNSVIYSSENISDIPMGANKISMRRQYRFDGNEYYRTVFHWEETVDDVDNKEILIWNNR